MKLFNLTFTSSEDLAIKIKNSLEDKEKKCDVSSACDYLIYHQNSQHQNPTDENTFSKIEHWWVRKWQVSLDFYLSTPNKESSQQKTNTILEQTEHDLDIILPDEKEKDLLSPVEALLHRKTYRKFQDVPLSKRVFSKLLKELKEELFTGIWKYITVIFNVEGIEPGIYRYCSERHGLVLIRQGLFREEIVKLLCGMMASSTAAFLMVLAVDLKIAMENFSYDRALREIYIDSGRLAQKLLIKGMQNLIGGLPSPAMQDTQLCSFLDMNPATCIPIYNITMGIIPESILHFKVTK